MKLFPSLTIIVAALYNSFSLFGGSINIISWNIKDFGQSRDEIEIEAIANLLRDADIVAIQEVVAKHPGGALAVARLSDNLNRKGAKWDYTISEPTKCPSNYMSERYAFLWKTSKIKLKGKAKLLMELDDLVYREPYFATFVINNEELAIINYHSRTHNNKDDEKIEIEAISNWLITQRYINAIWLGDFNLEYTNTAFNNILGSGFQPAFKGEKTTLKSKCINGDYLSLAEDNIFYKLKNLVINSKSIIDFVGGNCNEVFLLRNKFSDHLPIQVKLNYE